MYLWTDKCLKFNGNQTELENGCCDTATAELRKVRIPPHLTSRARRRIHDHNSSLIEDFQKRSELLSSAEPQAQRATNAFGNVLKRPENESC